jgi:hypothetical protein
MNHKPFFGRVTFALVAIAVGAPLCFAQTVSWDTYADTWVATDGLGRVLPTNAEVGPPKANHTVGIFYYLWLPGARTTNAGPFDNTEIMKKDPDALSKPSSPLWGSLYGFQHWGEPLLGYYRIFDDYVLRKHAQMLSDAGVDVVLFDTTNSYSYFDQVSELADVWLDVQSHGQAVPKIVFTCRAGLGDRQTKQVKETYETIYKNPKYAPLWFNWKGKPLIIASPDPVRMSPEILSYFTFRKLLWPGKPLSNSMWSLDNSLPYNDGNDRLGVDEDGNLEEMAAAVAVSNAGGPMSTLPPVNSRAWRGRKGTGHLETDPNAVRRGGQFQDEWDFLLAHDPKFALIYCWNEWVAQKFVNKQHQVMIVDEFNEEHSKDIEPMTGGHGDDYVYEMIANIRKYRGVRPIPPITTAPITLDGNFDDWKSVMPEYRDTIGDPAKRDSDAFGKRAPHYTNTTGRNDLKLTKVSADADRLYFLIRTEGPLIQPDTDAPNDDWMTLYIDSDRDSKTGWLGYDLRVSPRRKVIEKNVDGKYEWTDAQKIDVAVGADGIELAIPRSYVKGNTFDFKWTDHCYEHGDWTDFTVNGDAAPNDRFNYRAILR